MFENLSIKSRRYSLSLLSVLLVGIGMMGLTSLNVTNNALRTSMKTVCCAGPAERMSMLMNRTNHDCRSNRRPVDGIP